MFWNVYSLTQLDRSWIILQADPSQNQKAANGQAKMRVKQNDRRPLGTGMGRNTLTLYYRGTNTQIILKMQLKITYKFDEISSKNTKHNLTENN